MATESVANNLIIVVENIPDKPAAYTEKYLPDAGYVSGSTDLWLEGTILEPADDIPLRIDMSAVENGEIGDFFGIGSQTFTLPGTWAHDRFFHAGFEVGAEWVPGMYQSMEVSVIYKGETLMRGNMRVLEILTDDQGYHSYKVQITDQVVQFKEALADKLIKDADWSAYAHTLTSGSIVDSWNDNLLGGSVFYPLCDFGTDDPDGYPARPRVQLSGLSGSVATGSIDSPDTPMRGDQFLPAIKAKDVLDVIFEQAGYSYTGSFAESEDFNNIYILPKAQEGLGITNQDGIGNTATILRLVNYPVGPVSTSGVSFSNKVPYDIEVSDPGNNYNNSTYIYTIPIDGYYEFSGRFGYFNFATPAVDVSVLGELKVDGVTKDGDYQYLTAGDGNGPYQQIMSYAGNFTAGQQVWIQFTIDAESGPGFSQTFVILGSYTDFKCTTAPLVYNNVPVDMSLQWESQTKSIDVLKGLIQQFNLVLYPENNWSRVIRIETFKDWMFQGEEKDWTDKVDQSSRTSIKHTLSEQPRELIFANENDADRFSKLALESAPNYQYGTIRTIASTDIPQGSKKVGSFFGPTVLGSPVLCPTADGGVDSSGNPTYNLSGCSMPIPHLYKFDNNKQTAYKFRPRIGYKVNLTVPNGVSGSGAYGGQIHIGYPNASIAVSSYATISNVSDLPVVPTETNDLLFNNTYAPLVPDSYGMTQSITAYQKYWQTYTESLYWDGSRKVTADLLFEPYEYKNIRLNDIIFVKDQKYRINKISGYNLVRPDVATVELIRLYPQLDFVGYNCDCIENRVDAFYSEVDAIIGYRSCDGIWTNVAVTAGTFEDICMCVGSQFVIQGEAIFTKLGECEGPTPPEPCVCVNYDVTNNDLEGSLLVNYINCDTGLPDGYSQAPNTVSNICACSGSVTGRGADFTITVGSGSCGSTPTPTPTVTPTPTPTITPTPTPTSYCAECRSYVVTNTAPYPQSFGYTECSTGTSQYITLGGDSDSREFCACSGSVSLYGGGMYAGETGTCYP